jgi:hypothetical protein
MMNAYESRPAKFASSEYLASIFLPEPSSFEMTAFVFTDDGGDLRTTTALLQRGSCQSDGSGPKRFGLGSRQRARERTFGSRVQCRVYGTVRMTAPGALLTLTAQRDCAAPLESSSQLEQSLVCIEQVLSGLDKPLATPAGLQPATSALGKPCSMRLSYGATPDGLAVQKTRGKMGPG